VLPVLTLVGRPNVGKSTLFNQLTRTRDALVADVPGLTRDRRYGVGHIGPASYVVVDTGGLSGAAQGVEALMERQVVRAVEEADYLLFLVDAREGCTGDDAEIAERLRRTGKPLTLVVNKTDHLDPAVAAAEFHVLGLGDPFPIAAAHGRGVASLIEEVFARLPRPEPDIGQAAAPSAGIQIAVVGRPNAGKSTLINRLLGDERLVTFDSPGTTRDSIRVPFRRGEQAYTLIDTAGVRRRSRVRDVAEKFSIIKTLQAIEGSNVVILVLDAREGIGEQDATLAGHIIESGRALVVAVNKWDGLPQEQRNEIRRSVARKLGFLDFAAVHFVSALHGSGVGLLLDEVDLVFANATRDLGTPQLNSILQAAVQERQPPLARGRRIKLRYAHQGGRNPPLIVIHGNQTAEIPDAYRRFLMRRFREALNLYGTPLRIEFRTGANPFRGRRNRLTPRQERKRKRLKEFVRRKP
jgi:GTP-binding protein